MNDSAFEEKVNHPSHYNAGRIEVIDFIEDQNLNFNLGNAVKYISRAGKKDPKKFREDLEKAIWYLNRELAKQK
nr:MAG TPA: nucelotide kinase [Caudoviricetes sp.]